MKRGILLVVLLTAAALPAAAGVRSISTVTFHRYSFGAGSTAWEQVGILPVSRRVSVLCGVYGDDREGWRNRIARMGVVAGMGRTDYAEMTYAYGADSDGKRTDYYALEATRETARSIASIGYKYTASPENPFHTVSPGLRYAGFAGLTLGAKAYVTYDAGARWNYAYVADMERRIWRMVSLKAGITAGDRLFSNELDRQSAGAFHSLFAGGSVSLGETAAVRYLGESLRREGLYDDLSHTVVLDVRFR